VARQGIRVNAIAPTWVRTPLIRPITENPEVMKRIEEITPMGRIAEPEELVGAVLFLAFARLGHGDRPRARRGRRVPGAVRSQPGGESVALTGRERMQDVDRVGHRSRAPPARSASPSAHECAVRHAAFAVRDRIARHHGRRRHVW